MSRPSAQAKRRSAEQIPARSLRPVIGPGLIAASVLSLVLWRQSVPPAPPGPPRIDHSRVEPVRPSAASAPDPDWLVSRETALGLTPAQANRLHRMKARWDRDTAALQVSLSRAEAAFRREVAPNEGRNPDIDRFRQAAEPFSDLSWQLSSAREAWWSEASSVLNADQRRRARELWTSRLSEGRRSHADRQFDKKEIRP